ncbi:restriction endonuclease [Actinacidiphila acididurans]|uniref:Restriction endonuclease n=1 Tax=Actinacidiphila acididurans TaxID=2784346 RepID=A0ABS2U586_9ACTN|nr:restriction endonuclease [Actinacidiphila acididurans]MBM9510331.1 restriction endonuclease [Actinacidiphila acididurans]
MSRRPPGLVSTWAEIQRQQQRQTEAQRRARAQAEREQQRQRRAAERAQARSRQEEKAAYRARREEDARRRTAELDERFSELTGLLRAGVRAPAFAPEAMYASEELAPFAPGRLAEPVVMPRPEMYGLGRQSGWGRPEERQARAAYERDLAAAGAAERRRQEQLAAYREEYRRWAEQRLADIRRHNAGVRQTLAALERRDPEAVEEYLTAALYASPAWPEGLPRQVSASFEPPERRLVLTWELPAYAAVPEAAEVRYMPTADRDKEVPRPAAERRTAYRDLVAQCMLLVLRDLFAADHFELLDSVLLSGFVNDTDPATGHRSPVFLASVLTSREVFTAVNLSRVNPVDCLVEGLGGELSARPDKRVGVAPVRLPGESGRTAVSHGGGEEPDLLAMDPLEFEELVAELFRAMGMQAVTTVRSGDGGVDVDALDPDPIRGGKIAVQVKRYRNTVNPGYVRDLFGTVQSTGANKGVLITTSGFGPTSYAFANGKPLTLVSGTELVELLHQHGLAGRLGPAPAGADAAARPATASPDDEPDASVLGLWWQGPVRLDVCALVCRGGRALGDDHFVFFNNPRTPDGSVRMMPALGEDKAALWVDFERLPDRADRLVLLAAIDPAVNPDADLSGFTGARIRLTDPSGAEIDRLEVSDGRPGETALILGSFRKRPGGDWNFVPGGKGYQGPGGLVELVQEHGIEVE